MDFDKVGTSPYAANGYVPERLLRLLVVSMSQIGRHLFPQVYLAVRDVDSNSGLLPVPLMDGAGGWCVGYTIDMSINLGNSSYFDVLNASQGFRLWNDESRGRGVNWYFVMPNLCYHCHQTSTCCCQQLGWANYPALHFPLEAGWSWWQIGWLWQEPFCEPSLRNINGGERAGCACRTPSGRRCGGEETYSTASGP